MQNKTPPEISKVARDPDLFVWFMTLVILGVYALTLYNQPHTRQLGVLAPFTVLTIAHLLLHWQLGKIIMTPVKVIGYILIQGVLALIISMYAQNIGMIFALFMALIGEAVGLYGLNRRGLLAGAYYMVLLAIGLVQLSGWATSIWVILSTIPMTLFVVIYVTLYMRQVDAREKAQSLTAELEAANLQLAEYAAQVEDLTITNERQRMARELHDTLSQGLAGIILQLEAVEAHLASDRPEKAKTILTNTMLQARATLADARAAIDDLRTSSLDDLEATLSQEISRFTDATGIPCNYHADQLPSIPEPVKEIVIRTVAEGLINIARHAQAHQANITVSVKETNLFVRIQDDGQGFDANGIPSGHYGLLGLRERVRLANGTFDLKSTVGSGTTLETKIPL